MHSAVIVFAALYVLCATCTALLWLAVGWAVPDPPSASAIVLASFARPWMFLVFVVSFLTGYVKGLFWVQK